MGGHNHEVIVMAQRGIAGSDRGATAVEYGLVIGGIAIVVLASVALIGRQVSSGMSPVAASLAASSQAADAAVLAGGTAPLEPASAGDGAALGEQPTGGGSTTGSGAAGGGSTDGTPTGSQPAETIVAGSGVQEAASATGGESPATPDPAGNQEPTTEAAPAPQPQLRALSAPDWSLLSGTATISGTTVTTTHPANNAWQSTSVINALPWTSTDITLTSTMRLVLPPNTTGYGYGVWLRATPNTSTKTVPSGYTFQVDPGMGNRFALKVWNDGAETTLAMSNFPAGFDPLVDNQISVSMVGEQFVATVNGTEVLRVNNLTDLAQAKGKSAPTGTQFGLRTWQKADAVMTGTAVR